MHVLLVSASGNISVGDHVISAGLPLAEQRITLRLDGPVAHLLAGGVLVCSTTSGTDLARARTRPLVAALEAADYRVMATSLPARSDGRTMRQPYFATHGVGVLYFLVLVTWYGAEIVMFFRQLQWRKGAKRIAQPGFWAFFRG